MSWVDRKFLQLYSALKFGVHYKVDDDLSLSVTLRTQAVHVIQVDKSPGKQATSCNLVLNETLTKRYAMRGLVSYQQGC